jgi:tight adherence protein B
MNPLLIVLIFLATVLAVEGAFTLIRGRRESESARIRRRLQSLSGRGNAAEAARRGGENSLLRDAAAGGSSLIERSLRGLPNRASVELLLYRAGMPMTPSRFLLVSALMTFGGWVLGYAIMNDPVLGVVGALAGLIPWLAIRMSARKRMHRFDEQFPDALELLTRALRAGHALSTGFQLVGEEMTDPMGTEFAQVAEEIKFGLDVRTALTNLVQRVGAQDLPYFVTAVLIQRETGGNLAELLDKLGELVRERHKFYGKVRALTAQSRLSAVILALWLPVLVVGMALLRPEYIGVLFESSIGYTILGFAAALDLAGYLVARKLADVEA